MKYSFLLVTFIFFSSFGLSEEMTYFAKKIIEKAQQGDSSKQADLALMYSNGNEVNKDYTQAFFWAEKSAKQGNPFGQYVLGSLYYNGVGVKKDYKEALYWYKESGKQNMPISLWTIGNMYLDGEGVAKDTAIADAFFFKACKIGHTLGCSDINL